MFARWLSQIVRLARPFACLRMLFPLFILAISCGQIGLEEALLAWPCNARQALPNTAQQLLHPQERLGQTLNGDLSPSPPRQGSLGHSPPPSTLKQAPPSPLGEGFLGGERERPAPGMTR